MSKDTRETGARRRFLRTLGAAGAAGAVAATAPLVTATPAAARESREEMTKARYQANSPDVQAYYRTNRYER